MILNFVSELPLTRIRLFFARILYLVVKTFVKSQHVTAIRKGITYSLDLSEGIDLSVFVFGNYQPLITKNKYYTIPENACIFDVGANMGCMTLQFAKKAVNGHVYAFEPADFAYGKLLENINLNPLLKKRITPVKKFASDTTSKKTIPFAMSSWKTDSLFKKGHPVHGGEERKTSFATCTTIDMYCFYNSIKKVDLIKIDTEGHELSVLNGAVKTIESFKPVVIFETGQYQMTEQGVCFTDYLDVFIPLGYRLVCLQNNKDITIKNFENLIPLNSTVDIIAIP